MRPPLFDEVRIGVIGLGYVGLPLAFELARVFPVHGFDLDAGRIEQLRKGHDRTREVDPDELIGAGIDFSTDAAALARCNVFIVTVPTPIDAARRPDLGPLLAASETVGCLMRPGSIVIFESTVYPGATEEECVPVLERTSRMRCNIDFGVGYSPERVNPGDRAHRIPDIVKVTSGSTPEVSEFVDGLYRRIMRVGTHRAESIRVAEAAKVIENTQRDVNIALINELAMLFHRLGLDTEAVLAAAATKWNFLRFRPGLVGGHCIGVDPYYLTHRAQMAGFHPRMILAGRQINDGMGSYVAERIMKCMTRKRIHVVDSRILILGATFKEDVPDMRNSRVIDMVREFRSFNANVDVHDPCADPEAVEREFDLVPVARPEPGSYDAVVLAVAHAEFREAGISRLRAYGRDDSVFYDVKAMFSRTEVDERL